MVDSNYTSMEDTGKGILCTYKIPECINGKSLLIACHVNAIVFFELDENEEPYKCVTGVNNEFDPWRLGGEDKVEEACISLAENIYNLILHEIKEKDWNNLNRPDESCKLAYTNALFGMCLSK